MEINLVTCPQHSTILRFVSGELSDDDAREFRAHLDACAVCREAHAEIEASWEHLGAWEVDVGAFDVRPGVNRALNEPLGSVWNTVWRVHRWRWAASLLLAVGLGAGAGTLVPVSGAERPPLPSVDEVSESVGLVYFSDAAVLGLVDSLDPGLTGDATGDAP